MGTDKALLVFEGEPLVVRAARLLGEVCGEVLIASGDGRRLPVDGCRQVADVVPDAGPLSGLVAGLEAARYPVVAVAAVDMPHLSPAVFRLLAERWAERWAGEAGGAGEAGEAAVVPTVGGLLQPLHALYARDPAAPALRRLLEAGEFRLREAVDALNPLLVAEAAWGRLDPQGRFARNLNVPADWDAMELRCSPTPLRPPGREDGRSRPAPPAGS